MKNLRVFNNFIKKEAINYSVRCMVWDNPKAIISVLDVGCGKGGDFNKMERIGAKKYIGIDSSIG